MKRTRILLGLLLLIFSGGCADNEANFSSEGSVAEPIQLGAAPTSHEGTVAGGGNSYYSATSDGGAVFTLSQMRRNADFVVYASSDFTFPLCLGIRPNSEPDTCQVTICPSPCTHYVRVLGVDGGGTPFLLSLE